MNNLYDCDCCGKEKECELVDTILGDTIICDECIEANHNYVKYLNKRDNELKH